MSKYNTSNSEGTLKNESKSRMSISQGHDQLQEQVTTMSFSRIIQGFDEYSEASLAENGYPTSAWQDISLPTSPPDASTVGEFPTSKLIGRSRVYIPSPPSDAAHPGMKKNQRACGGSWVNGFKCSARGISVAVPEQQVGVEQVAGRQERQLKRVQEKLEALMAGYDRQRGDAGARVVSGGDAKDADGGEEKKEEAADEDQLAKTAPDGECDEIKPFLEGKGQGLMKSKWAKL